MALSKTATGNSAKSSAAPLAAEFRLSADPRVNAFEQKAGFAIPDDGSGPPSTRSGPKIPSMKLLAGPESVAAIAAIPGQYSAGGYRTSFLV